MSHISVQQEDSWFNPTELDKEVVLYYTSCGKALEDSYSGSYKNFSEKIFQKYFCLITSELDKNNQVITSNYLIFTALKMIYSENHPLYKYPNFKSASAWK